jgi:putative transposase
MPPALVWATGKRPEVVKAHSLLCYWASREFGITMTALARRLSISQPAVSIAARQGEKIAMEKDYRLSVGQ